MALVEQIATFDKDGSGVFEGALDYQLRRPIEGVARTS